MKKNISIIGTLGLLLGIGIGALEGWEQGGTLKGAAIQSIYRLTGIDVIKKKWVPGDATGGMIFLGSVGATIVGRKVGVNRMVPLPKGFKVV